MAYDHGVLNVAIENIVISGSVLHITTDILHPKNHDSIDAIGISPKLISKWINQALNLGWNTVLNKSQLKVKIEDGLMKII